MFWRKINASNERRESIMEKKIKHEHKYNTGTYTLYIYIQVHTCNRKQSVGKFIILIIEKIVKHMII